MIYSLLFSSTQDRLHSVSPQDGNNAKGFGLGKSENKQKSGIDLKQSISIQM